MKKRILSLALTALALLALAGCGKTGDSSPVRQPKDYVGILGSARSDDENEAFAIVHGKTGETTTMTGLSGDEAASMSAMALETFGLDETLCSEYALSISLMNVHAYGVGIFLPAAGKADAVKQAAETYVAAQVKAQQNYLPDQYEIAKSAVVEQVPSGEIVLAMCEDADEVAARIQKALAE